MAAEPPPIEADRLPAAPPPPPVPTAPRAWLVIGPIIVQSSATLFVSLAMLVLGLAAGFLLRPFVPLGGTPLAVATTASDSASSGLVGSAEQTQAAADGAALMTALVQGTRHFIGSADAPVTIIEFADFQCPYCGRFALDTYPQIDQAYIASGQVRVGYQHFAFLGEESFWAAEASECAGDQDAFWPYHDYLFAHQSGENQGAFTKANLKTFAANLGLDTAAFNSCLENGVYRALVSGQTQAAQQLGVRSTPTFVVNGRPILGAQPYDVFAQYIGEALGN
ncbi:MAG: DsbA family protein [Anaerolineales bacterium]|nr:DsbA family protein [Anaerolineales bacterium]